MGFAGSGKTFTATLVAIGLQKYIKSEKPIAFIDTETGSDFVLPKFKAAGIELITAKSRAFVDLVAVTREAEKRCDILIIDSITHFYVELIEAYMKKLNRTRLRVQDWGPIKQEWREFTDLYINSKLHILMCGRAGWEYDFREDEDGVTEIAKTGTKMKAETEMGYEPSLLVEMEKVKEANGKIGQVIGTRAWVLKDRFDVINGKSFDNPGFTDFLPHISLLNIGGEHLGVDNSGSSQALFDSPEGRSNLFKRREIAIESLKIECDKRWSNRSDSGLKSRIQALESVFGTASQTAIADLHPDKLEAGLKKIKEIEVKAND
jgi:hypothetical protein